MPLGTANWRGVIRTAGAHDTAMLATLSLAVQSLPFDRAFVRRFGVFDAASYTRSLLYKDSRLEVLALGWQGGQSTAVHDHGGSVGITRVVQGDLLDEIFEPDPQTGALSLVRTCLLTAGTTVEIPSQRIHRQSLFVEGQGLTVHLYVEPLRTLGIYANFGGDPEPQAPRPYDRDFSLEFGAFMRARALW